MYVLTDCRKSLGRIAALVLSVCLLVGVFGTAAWAGPPQHAGHYVVFNNPTTGRTHDFRIENDLIKLINKTPSGESIYGSMYSWTRTPVAQALSDAAARGVHVRLAIDARGAGGQNADPANPAQAILRAANFDQLVYCSGPNNSTACTSTRPNSINHNKLFTFSRSGHLRQVVWIASQNFTDVQGTLFNNEIVYYGRQGLYDEFVRHVQHMLAQERTPDYFHTDVGYYRTPDGEVTVYLSPRPDSWGGMEDDGDTDAIVLMLRKIKVYEPGCRIDLVQSQFNRREAVARELVRIAGLGCQVRLAGGGTMVGFKDYVYPILHDVPNIDLRGFHDAGVNIHSKYMLIHANYDGTHRDLVLTGSTNIDTWSLRRHNDILIVVDNPKVSRAYDRNFDMIWRRTNCVDVPDEPYCMFA